tara:strand:- start:124222 stop:126363 length:2142 start_codon:yes stop_codon:yes gene_type:complete
MQLDGLYICLISIHGLIRGDDPELGRDADTGGQTKYVLDLARALAAQSGVSQVDLVTRRIPDSAVSDDYSRMVEPLCEGARIVRIDCGPDEYLPKERLWDYLDSFSDNLLLWLGEQPRLPSLVHSHYADAGYVAVRLSNLLSVPLVHTGHSLGRDKRKRLLAQGLSRAQIEETYNIERRIDAEEEVLANADLVVTSTHNEIEEQYGLYNFYDPERMAVIPPGTNLELFHPAQDGEHFDFVDEIKSFLQHPEKPLILSLSRPDERKNILTLIEAYGESPALQQAANLLIIAGNRDDIRDLEHGAQTVLTNVLLWIDSYDLYGKVAVPKHHRPDQVPEIYRLAASTGGVFINPALTEPFGLTLLEAAASGLPVVATENGGPVDIIRNCRCGELIDPLDKADITAALLRLLESRKVWNKAARNGIDGVRRHYSWQAHAGRYLEHIQSLPAENSPLLSSQALPRTLRYRDRMIVSDLDQNLLGDDEALARFIEQIRSHRKSVTFAIATGRRVDSALALMKKYNIPSPDVLISSLGTQIHYGQALSEDVLWTDHIDHDWSPRRIRQSLSGLAGLELQERQHQTSSKISYYTQVRGSPTVEEINTVLRKAEINANVVFSFGQFVDVLPSRASKGQALRYVAQRLDIPLDQVLVAGGSGADEDMMRGNTLGVVVANRHDEELSTLADVERVYFARSAYAEGVLEAIDYYDFFGNCRVPLE